MSHKTVTLGEIRSELTSLLAMPDSTEVIFGAGDLSFYRTKPRRQREGRTPALVQIEFNEIYTVTHDPESAA